MEAAEAEYCRAQLITYLGNKRKQLSFIDKGVQHVRERLGGKPLRCFDAFAGSGVVSRYLKRYSSDLYSNDLEPYAAVLGSCYLANRSVVKQLDLPKLHAKLKATIGKKWAPGLIAELYAPQDDRNIRPDERAYYTRRNAVYLDTARCAIAALPLQVQPYFLAPLLYEASVHANTGIMFKSFYKGAKGCGQFGGRKGQSLDRIMADIELPMPIFSEHECNCMVLQGDATRVARKLKELDMAYLDPPCNQYPYSSNYFMLNLLTEYKRPEKLSRVSGIPQGWNRSDYNSRARAAGALKKLLSKLPTKYALLSYHAEGLLTRDEILELAAEDWKVQVMEQDSPARRADRAPRTTERLYVMERR